MKAKKTIFNTSVATSILLCVIWPALSVPAGVFTKSYFAFWVFIALLWGLVATFVIIVLPLYESYDQIMMVLYGLMGYTYVPPGAARARLGAGARDRDGRAHAGPRDRESARAGGGARGGARARAGGLRPLLSARAR